MKNKRIQWKDFELKLIHKAVKDFSGKLLSPTEAEKLKNAIVAAGGKDRTTSAVTSKYKYERWKQIQDKKKIAQSDVRYHDVITRKKTIGRPKRFVIEGEAIEKSIAALMDTLKEKVIDLVKDYESRGQKLNNLERIIKG